MTEQLLMLVAGLLFGFACGIAASVAAWLRWPRADAEEASAPLAQVNVDWNLVVIAARGNGYELVLSPKPGEVRH